STPWMAATFGNPHLKTIVPISGLHGLAALVTRNGTSEARAASFQNVVYGQFEVDGDAGDIQAVCPDAIMAGPMGAGALVTGDQVLPMEDSYWAEREFFPRVLENYEGSVYWIHGLQDWNVDPHMISPSFHLLREKGLDVKGLFGQWGHMYPDRPGEHAGLPEGLGAFPYSVRFDWAEDLKEWFDFYLKGEGPKPLLKVEVQDNIGRWRVEDTYPPLDFAEVALQPTGADQTISPAANGAPLDLGVLSETNPVALSGHIYLNAAVTPSGANGQIHFTVRDTESGYRLAFGTMDLRYRGPEQPATIPGQQVIVRVQSEPFDFVVPAGHHLELVVRQTGDGLLPSPSAAPMTFSPAASQVLVPEIDRAPSDYFTPPAWKETATASAPQP
ncbi:MAG: X-Pro dipeptidyl-peptidase, partial [Thermoplasmata archaeon]|nr:X-Pro dipeptidyl-peptidase [Thermoplasmata archaeon]